MADIKVKQSKKGTVKTINKAVVGTEKMKDKLVQAKDKTRETYQEEPSDSGTEYAINKISKTTSNMPNDIYRLNKYGKRNFDKTVQNIQNVSQKMKTIKMKNRTKKAIKQMKSATKTTQKAIKTADRSIKTTKQVAKTTTKTTKRAIQITKATIKATVHGIKAIAKAIKTTVTATKSLVSALLAGGWIVGIIILIICIIGMACAMLFGGEIEQNSNIVAVAMGQVGNVGGEKFWKWYGFSERVEWCAIFVSWCANECGYIENGTIPRFASCEHEGVPYFKTNNLWQDKGTIPKSGDIIFFDWDENGTADHVGIVQKTDLEKVYTIEGNSGDKCKQNEYNIDSSKILGYGTPLYLTNEIEERY